MALNRQLLSAVLNVSNAAQQISVVTKQIAAIQADAAANAVLVESLPELQTAVAELVAAVTPAKAA